MTEYEEPGRVQDTRPTQAYLHRIQYADGHTKTKVTVSPKWPFEDAETGPGSTLTAELVFRGNPIPAAQQPATITVRDAEHGTVEVTKVFPGDVIAKEYEAQAQGGWEVDPLLTTAARNLRSYLSKASFSSVVDKRAAENCVEVLASAATAPPSAPETEENVAADSYHYMTELLEPYVAREGSNPDGPFPASVVESFQMLLEHWKATQQPPSAPVGVDG